MISVEQFHIVQGDFKLADVSFDVPQGGYAVLMGRTGCGKTTILEAICGLRPLRDGRIRLGGRDVTRLKPAERGLGYVPQDGALFMTMTVLDHLAFAPRVHGWKPPDIAERTSELAELLGISSLLSRQPHGLSGGERQRVALGRALACYPSVLLLDEPLSALDDETRTQMYDVLDRVRRKTNVTTLHVSHNRQDAERLADHLFVLAEGKLRRETIEPDERRRASGNIRGEALPSTSR